MFEVAELDRKVSREEFKAQEPALREALMEAQLQLKEGKARAYIVLMSGVEGAGKGEAVNLLLEWLDAREIETWALGSASEQERQMPRFHRFWSRLPAKGRGAIFLGHWYSEPIVERALGTRSEADFERSLQRIVEFEEMLSNEGIVLVKLWLHLSKKEQRARLEAMAEDPEQSWRLTDRDWELHDHYDALRQTSERALRRTSTGASPWHVIEAADRRHRDLAVARALREALERAAEQPPERGRVAHELEPPELVNILRRLDLSVAEDGATYEAELDRWQARLGCLSRLLVEEGRSVVVVFEGWDAAGKGGAIRRITQSLDARFYQVISIAAPTDEEKARPYLWRFWRRLPAPGHASLFDRSWYGRVLVERVEGFCEADDWRRAFGEINAFEEQLVLAGTVVAKFWLHISPEEQLRRFEARAQTGYKRHKITPEDWRNRDKWPLYESAACEMIAQTSTEIAPWTLVEAENKEHARLKVIRALCDRIERVLDVDGDEVVARFTGRAKKKSKKKKK
jgi:polyphosphate:AMP phosphotransferase